MRSDTFIDLYCERTGPEFWNEPVNALSNAAFILAAWLALRTRSSRQDTGDIGETITIVMGGMVGVGSFTFHTIASHWAQLFDIVAIWMFVIAYLLIIIHRLVNKTSLTLGLFVALCMIVATVLMQQLPSLTAIGHTPSNTHFNGTLAYAPVLLALTVFSAIAYRKKMTGRRVIFASTLLFAAALLFRTVDLISCELTNGLGTHFIWHLLSALLMGILLQFLVKRMPPRGV